MRHITNTSTIASSTTTAPVTAIAIVSVSDNPALGASSVAMMAEPSELLDEKPAVELSLDDVTFVVVLERSAPLTSSVESVPVSPTVVDESAGSTDVDDGAGAGVVVVVLGGVVVGPVLVVERVVDTVVVVVGGGVVGFVVVVVGLGVVVVVGEAVVVVVG